MPITFTAVDLCGHGCKLCVLFIKEYSAYVEDLFAFFQTVYNKSFCFVQYVIS